MKKTRLTRNMAEGESLSFDGGRIVFTVEQRSGRLARVCFEMAPDVVIDRLTAEQKAEQQKAAFMAGGLVT